MTFLARPELRSWGASWDEVEMSLHYVTLLAVRPTHPFHPRVLNLLYRILPLDPQPSLPILSTTLSTYHINPPTHPPTSAPILSYPIRSYLIKARLTWDQRVRELLDDIRRKIDTAVGYMAENIKVKKMKDTFLLCPVTLFNDL